MAQSCMLVGYSVDYKLGQNQILTPAETAEVLCVGRSHMLIQRGKKCNYAFTFVYIAHFFDLWHVIKILFRGNILNV